MEKEVWKDVAGYEGKYKVSDQGRVLSLKSNLILKQRKTKNGYLQVHLRNKKISRTMYVHRLVGAAFCSNPKGLNEINHLDENKENNIATNLQWCTHLENLMYGTRNIRVSIKKKNNVLVSFHVEQYTKDGRFIKSYPSMAEASRQTGFLVGEISRATRGIYKTYKGFVWERKK